MKEKFISTDFMAFINTVGDVLKEQVSSHISKKFNLANDGHNGKSQWTYVTIFWLIPHKEQIAQEFCNTNIYHYLCPKCAKADTSDNTKTKKAEDVEDANKKALDNVKTLFNTLYGIKFRSDRISTNEKIDTYLNDNEKLDKYLLPNIKSLFGAYMSGDAGTIDNVCCYINEVYKMFVSDSISDTDYRELEKKWAAFYKKLRNKLSVSDEEDRRTLILLNIIDSFCKTDYPASIDYCNAAALTLCKLSWTFFYKANDIEYSLIEFCYKLKHEKQNITAALEADYTYQTIHPFRSNLNLSSQEVIEYFDAFIQYLVEKDTDLILNDKDAMNYIFKRHLTDTFFKALNNLYIQKVIFDHYDDRVLLKLSDFYCKYYDKYHPTEWLAENSFCNALVIDQFMKKMFQGETEEAPDKGRAIIPFQRYHRGRRFDLCLWWPIKDDYKTNELFAKGLNGLNQADDRCVQDKNYYISAEETELIQSSNRRELYAISECKVSPAGTAIGYEKNMTAFSLMCVNVEKGLEYNGKIIDSLEKSGISVDDISIFNSVVVNPANRGMGLQQLLIQLLTKLSMQSNKTILTATVSQTNRYSYNNFLKGRYIDKTLEDGKPIIYQLYDTDGITHDYKRQLMILKL